MTMPGLANLHFDVASAISQGQRDCQEDALICDFPQGAGLGFAVLADGMGGHAAGDIASKIVVTEVFSELKLQSGDPNRLERNISDVLEDAASAANNCIQLHTSSEPGTEGMGATLVAPVLISDHLYWVSIGDSPLFLFRGGMLVQLNEDHSMAPQIDYLVRSGLMTPETAQNHPDRQCLTSVLSGQQIPRIDCPQAPVKLRDGDIIVVASDGLQFIEDDEIAVLLANHKDNTSAEISAVLLRALTDLNDPDQDNVTFCVIKVQAQRPAPKLAQPVHAPSPEIDAREELAIARKRKESVTIMASASDRRMSMMYRISSERSA